MERTWSTLKRSHDGIFHHSPKKYLDRYVRELTA